jgi:hypothetical protein
VATRENKAFPAAEMPAFDITNLPSNQSPRNTGEPLVGFVPIGAGPADLQYRGDARRTDNVVTVLGHYVIAKTVKAEYSLSVHVLPGIES